MSQLVISNTTIPVDTQNRIKLNALHKASGLPDTKRPSIWLATNQAKELINELSQNSGFGENVINIVKGGSNSGTFAHELLAISYTGWISPQFQLEVNRVFLASKQPQALPEPTQEKLPNRFLTHLQPDGTYNMKHIPDDACVTNFHNLPEIIKDSPDIHPMVLGAIAEVCISKLSNQAMKKRLGDKNAK